MGSPKKGRGRFKKLLPLCLNQAAQVPARQKETARQMCEHLEERTDGEAGRGMGRRMEWQEREERGKEGKKIGRKRET